MRVPDPDVVARIIVGIADEEILPRFGALKETDIREKKPGDLVTKADERSEGRLTTALMALLPGSVVVGEEGVAADPARLSRLFGPEPVWIVDPLDGTRSFVRGRGGFTVIVALADQGRTVAGWIYRPLDRVMALAVTGEGATLAGHPIAIDRKGGDRKGGDRKGGQGLSSMTGVFVIPRTAGWRTDATRRLAHGLKAHRRIESAGTEYLDLLRSATDIAFFYRLNPWDHAAGVLIHQEAGGHGKFLDGSRYTPRLHEGPLLLAPDAESWDDAAAAMGSSRPAVPPAVP